MSSDISSEEALNEIKRLRAENTGLRKKLKEEKRQSRKTLQEKEHLNMLIESFGLGTWEHNAKTRKIEFNKIWSEQLGYSMEDIGNTVSNGLKLIHPSDLKKIKDIEKNYKQTNDPNINIEYRIKAKNGRWKWILSNGKIISKDKKGNPLKVIGANLDISHLKKIETKLREREKQYRALFEYAPIGLWEQDITELDKFVKQLKRKGITNFKKYFEEFPQELDKCITKIVPRKINRAALKIHDANSLKDIKDNLPKIFTTRSKEVFLNQIISYAEGNDTFESETETISLRGNHRKLKINVTYKKLPIKNKQVILFSLYDITEQKASERALRDSEHRYRSLFEISPTGIIIESPNGKILDANPALHKSFGYENNELIGRNIRELSHPQMHVNIEENIKTILSGITLKHIVKGTKKDGTLIYNELYETKISLSKFGDAVLCISNDITQQINTENRLKRNERFYKSLFYKNPLPMYIFEKETYKFLDVNEAAITKYGYSRKELANMTILDIRPKGEVNRVIRDIKLLTNGLEKRGIWLHKKKNGKTFYVEITAHSIDYFGQHGELILANDINEKMIAEKELEKSKNQIKEFAEHLEKIREEERTNIAREIHDNLGQSLTAIKLDLSWMESHCKETNLKVLNKIKLAKTEVDSSIETIQKISTSLRPRIIDDLGLTASLEWFIDDFIERSNIKCSLKISPKSLTFDKELSTNIFRIIQEALTNIIRHADASQVTIKLSKRKNEIKLLIKDNGRGIQKDESDRATSFGLIGIKERVFKFDGTVAIKGEKNKGTEIKIIIPLKE